MSVAFVLLLMVACQLCFAWESEGKTTAPYSIGIIMEIFIYFSDSSDEIDQKNIPSKSFSVFLSLGW